MKKVILFIISLLVLILLIFVFYSKKYSFSLSYGNQLISYKCLGKKVLQIIPGTTQAFCYGILINEKTLESDNSSKEDVKKDTKCDVDDKWVRIISPTDGQIFKEGEEVYVKWQYCNISSEDKDVKATIFLSKIDKIPTSESFYRIEYEKRLDDIDLGKGLLESHFIMPKMPSTVTKTNRLYDTREEVPLGNIGDYTVRLDISPFPEVQTGFSISGPIFAWDKVFIKINK